MSLIVAQTLLRQSLRIAGVTASGELPSTAEESDALITLNDLLFTWSLDGLTNYESTHITVPVNSLTVPINMPTPHTTTLDSLSTVPSVDPALLVQKATYRQGGIDYELKIISQADYEDISDKTISTVPQVIYINKRTGALQLYLYPVPPIGTEIRLTGILPLRTFATVSSSLEYPTGYETALRYNLAVMLAAEYGLTISQPIYDMATSSLDGLRLLKCKLTPPPQMVSGYPSHAMDDGTFILTGGY